MQTWRIVWITAIVSALISSAATIYYMGKPCESSPVGRYQIIGAEGFEKEAYWMLDTKTGHVKLWRKLRSAPLLETFTWVEADSGIMKKYGRTLDIADLAIAAKYTKQQRDDLFSTYSTQGEKDKAADLLRMNMAMDLLNRYPSEERAQHVKEILAEVNSFGQN